MFGKGIVFYFRHLEPGFPLGDFARMRNTVTDLYAEIVLLTESCGRQSQGHLLNGPQMCIMS